MYIGCTSAVARTADGSGAVADPPFAAESAEAASSPACAAAEATAVMDVAAVEHALATRAAAQWRGLPRPRGSASSPSVFLDSMLGRDTRAVSCDE